MAAVAVPFGYRRQPAVVYRRRRAVALLVLAGLVIALVTVVGRLGGGTLTASEPGSPSVQLVSAAVHVVAPGDTLWSIARGAQPTGDVRPLVQAMSAARHGRPLVVGERIAVPAAREITLNRR